MLTCIYRQAGDKKHLKGSYILRSFGSVPPLRMTYCTLSAVAPLSFGEGLGVRFLIRRHRHITFQVFGIERVSSIDDVSF